MAKRVPQPPSPDESGLEGPTSEVVAETAPADPAAPEVPKRRRAAAAGSSAKRAPRPRTRSSPQKHSKGHGLWEWVEASGLELVGIGRLRFLLRKFGLKGVLILALVAGYPVGQYSLISYAVNRSLPALAGDFGVVFEAEEWSLHPLALKAIARNVKIRPEHEGAGQPLFTAAEVEFQGTLLSSLRGVMDLVLLRPSHTFNEITVKHARVHLERSRTGTLNWSDYEEAMPEERRRELVAGLYRIHALKFENVSVAYVENLPGNSGGGVIQTVQASVFVDGINGAITDIGQAGPDDQLPTRVRVAARSSDGTIDIDGRMALRGGSAAAGDPRLQTVALRTARHEGLGYEIVIDLNNIGAAAFARSLPPTRVMAAGGSVRGRLKLRSAAPTCESNLAMENVRFTPNAQMVPSKAEYDSLYEDLRNRVESMEFKGCDPLTRETEPVSNRTPGRSAPPTAVAIAASFNEQANANAPPAVRAAVARDSESLTGRAASAVLDDMTKRFSKNVGQKIGGQTGQMVEGAINDSATATKSSQPSGNPVTRGLRRLFGGGKKPAPPKGGQTPATPQKGGR